VIEGINALRSVFIPNIIHMRNGTGKVAVPVQRNHMLYAHFKHITGIPANKNVSGVPVYKLRILDNLIERLVGHKVDSTRFLQITEENIDMIIEQVKNEVRSRETTFPSSGAHFPPETGIVINTFA
jgi:hypothetical protein